MMNKTITRLIRPEIKQLHAYHVPEPKDCIKLDAMENPYGWSETLQQQWLKRLVQAPINRYPSPDAKQLTQQLAISMDVPDNLRIILGNGSDELIQMIAMAVAKPHRSLMAAEPGFVMYKMIATMTGMDYHGIPLNDDFSLNLPAMLDAIQQHQPAVIFIAYPNNPTGNLFDRAEIEQIIQHSNGLVIVDEAYHVFSNQSFLAQINEYDNLLVMRTVSKMGLAGLRLGLLIGSEDWLTEINKVRLPYNINVLTQISVTFALENQAILLEQAEQICQQREWLFDALNNIDNITPFPSQANFILFRTATAQASVIHTQLLEHKILIKLMKSTDPLLKDCLRVSVGTAEENQAFIDVMKTL